MNKLSKFILQLSDEEDGSNKSNFAGAKKVEEEIIDEGCRRSGICMNFLKCTINNSPKIEKECGGAWKKMDSPIKLNAPFPRFAENPICYYENFEKNIVDELNKFLDKSFLSALNEKIPLVRGKQSTFDALKRQIAKMPKGQYRAIWNAKEVRELDPSWKGKNAGLSNEFAGWWKVLYSIRNFISPNVPQGEAYLVKMPLGCATIYREVDISQSQNCIFPVSVVINCSVKIALGGGIDAVRIKRMP